MKKYRLTDPKTLLGILSRLENLPISSVTGEQKYLVLKSEMGSEMAGSVQITLQPLQDGVGKPEKLLAILKENRVELKVKQANPYHTDLFLVHEISIEPLERTAKRSETKDIFVTNLHYSPPVNLGLVLSLNGKTSIIATAINQFSALLQRELTQYGFFLKDVEVGLFYSVEDPLLDKIRDSKSPLFIRDSYHKQIYTERGFLSLSNVFKEYDKIAILDRLSKNNTKSVLIVPYFSNKDVLLGYIKLTSNVADLGSLSISESIESPKGISALLNYLERQSDAFIFGMEIAYAKDWSLISAKENLKDLSQDGRGIGIELQNSVANMESIPAFSKITFQLLINGQMFTFFGNFRNLRPKGNGDETASLGAQVFSCDREEGMALIQQYAHILTSGEVR